MIIIGIISTITLYNYHEVFSCIIGINSNIIIIVGIENGIISNPLVNIHS